MTNRMGIGVLFGAGWAVWDQACENFEDVRIQLKSGGTSEKGLVLVARG